MDNLDTQWDNFDISDLDDISVDIEDTPVSINTTKKVANIIDKQRRDDNVDMDYDKFLDYDNPEGDQSADQSTRWRKLITHYEQNFKRIWAEKADKFNYEITKFKAKNNSQTNSSVNNFFQLRNNEKINELNAKRQNLVDWAKGMIEDINYAKGKASGFITDDNVVFYSEHPEAVRAELATDKYEYKPTTIK